MRNILNQAYEELEIDIRNIVIKQEDFFLNLKKYEAYLKKFEEFNHLLDFNNLSWHEKKDFVLEYGYLSWLFDDEIKASFLYFDDVENINILRFGRLSDGSSVNKILKLFPSDECKEDKFFSKIEQNMSKEKIISLIESIKKEFQEGKTKVQKKDRRKRQRATKNQRRYARI